MTNKQKPRYKLIKTKKTRHSFSINNLAYGAFTFYWSFIKLALDMIVDAVSAFVVVCFVFNDLS